MMKPVGGRNPFEEQFAKLGIRGAGTDPAAEAAACKAAAEAAKPVREVVLGYERRGGGGAVTTVREVPAARRTELLAELKRALGCGGTEDAGLLLFQGDHRARLVAWFEQRGTRVRGERGG
jgi:translation initiation factor 1 (eIF-1/SUI1)